MTASGTRLKAFGSPAAALLVLVCAVGIGFSLTQAPVTAFAVVGGVAIAAGAAIAGRVVLVQVTLAALPWFVVFAELMPPLVKTFTSAAAVLAVLVFVWPVDVENSAVRVGVWFFLTALLIGTVVATTGDQFIQTAKYLLFPAMAVAVASERGRLLLPRVRKVVLTSAVLALVTHIAIITLGLGAVGTYYGIGERLGFASLHNLALLSVIVAAAGLTGAKRGTTRFAYLCLGTIPAIATGVRSGLLAAIAVVVIFLIQSRVNLRAIALVGGLMLVVFATGMLSVAENRYKASQNRGEFASFSSAGSGRGAVWATAIQHWADAGPDGWIRGTGLRSITKIEEQESGNAVVGHSDIVEVTVQLGVVGFIGWLLIWIGLLRARLNSLVLVPIAVYAVVNGGIEYVDSLVFGLALAAACARPAQSGAPKPDPIGHSGANRTRLPYI